MASFSYTSVDRQGIQKQAVVEANNQNEAAKLIRDQGQFVVEIEEVGGSAGLLRRDANSALSKIKPLTSGQKVFFFRQLALMLRSGVTLLEALDITASLMQGKMVDICEDIAIQIRRGSNFSEAMESHVKIFSKLTPHIIRSGEASGELDVMLERIATHMQRRNELKSEVITSMVYPIFVIFSTVLVFLFLVFGVVPKIAEFLSKSGNRLPSSTQSLLDLRDFLVSHGLVLAVVLTICVFSFGWAYATQHNIRLFIDRFLLKIPIIGKLIAAGGMAQVCWALSMLLRSGLTIVEALTMASKTTSNQAYIDGLEEAGNKVLTGRDLGTSLRETALPSLVYQMASIGEKSGSLDILMEEAGAFYEVQLRHLSRSLSSLVQPILIVLIAFMVGYVYIGIIQALLRAAGGN